MLTETSATINKRYILHEKIGTGGMGTVYRATDRLSGQVVALKQVTAPTQNLVFMSRSEGLDLHLALAQEFKVLASLRHPHIISVLDYGFATHGVNGHRQRQPFFTMELLENVQTIQEAGQKATFAEKIRLLVQMLQALAYLHRRGVIHRDLKPSNVVVVDGILKVLDFGLSVTGESQQQLGGTTAGTLAYMSPEVLQGGDASEASDLYAVGVMAYELLAGHHPFDVGDVTELIMAIVATPVDVSQLDVDIRISALLERLLAKSPDARYTDASQVIAILSESANQPVSVETAATRESFLQAARLVGREPELQRLSAALSDAIEGRGSTWLIGGESGVGKSRLLDELRTHALVRGATVVRGQGITEGGSLYLLWRPALRWLSLLTDLDTDEASILKALVPDIGELLGYDVLDAPPEANPQKAHERLLAVIDKLFRSVRGDSPLVVILEDLHWASESVDMLGRLNSFIRDLPILLIGSYRDDEAPELPSKLPDVSLLKLERLAAPAIAELSEAMLGRAGRNPQVVRLLQRETEGNVFFLVEVVRALAEEAGGLESIGQMTLPDNVFAGGVQRIVQRRLARIPTEYYPLLQRAAVMGRQLDLKVLLALAGDVYVDVWLSACADAAVLDVQDDQWRFAHDKLREGLLAGLSDEERRQLHIEVAQAIEAIYPDSLEQAPILAHHYAAAGDDQKHFYYATLAGNQAMQQGANKEATGYFSRALESLVRLPESDDNRRQYIDTAIKLTRVGAYTIRGEDTKQMLERALAYAQGLGDEARQARVLANIGTLFYLTGRSSEAISYFQQVIGLAEKLGLEELLLLPYNFIGRGLLIQGDVPKSMPLLVKGITLAEKFNDPDLLSGSLAFYSVGLWTQGELEEAHPYAQRAIEVAEKLGHPSRISGTLLTLGAGYCFLDWFDDAFKVVSRGLDIAKETGDLQPLYAGNAEMGYVLSHTGKIAEGIAALEFSLAMAQKANLVLNLPQYQAWRAEADLLRGDVIAARIRLEEAVKLAETTRQILSRAEALRILSQACLASGDLSASQDAAEESIAIQTQLNAQVLLAKSIFQLGRVLLAKGAHEEGQAKLDQAEAMFTRYKMDYWLQQLHAAKA
jgi:serine/threonine protein kinase/tetratricopeptide (TPR) repeat protein